MSQILNGTAIGLVGDHERSHHEASAASLQRRGAGAWLASAWAGASLAPAPVCSKVIYSNRAGIAAVNRYHSRK